MLRAGEPGARLSTVPGIAPGADILVSAAGAARVSRALELIDAIEAAGTDPADVPESYWRMSQNRLSSGSECRVYGVAEQPEQVRR